MGIGLYLVLKLAGAQRHVVQGSRDAHGAGNEEMGLFWRITGSQMGDQHDHPEEEPKICKETL